MTGIAMGFVLSEVLVAWCWKNMNMLGDVAQKSIGACRYGLSGDAHHILASSR